MELLEENQKPISLPGPEENLPKSEKKSLKKRFGGSLRSIWHFFKRVLRFPFKTRRRKLVSFSLILLLVLTVILGVVVPVLAFYPHFKITKAVAQEFFTAYEKGDLEAIDASLKNLEKTVGDLEESYRYLAYFKVVPFANRYYADAGHILTGVHLAVDSGLTVTSTLIPYSEILGLKPNSSKKITVQQQLGNLLTTLPKVASELDKVWENLFLVKSELEQVDVNHYPQEVRGVKVRFWLEEANQILADLEPVIAQGRSVLETFPELLGSKRPRTYLVVFQNDGELRATGGFMTAFSLLTISKGEVVRNDVYPGVYVHRFQRYEAPPAPLGKYLGVERWFFHDLNFYPHYPTSAKKILNVWNQAGLPRVSGVLVVNTDTASSLLKITGPLEVPPYNWEFAQSGLPEPCLGGGKKFTSENLVCRMEYFVEKNPNRKLRGSATKEDIIARLSAAVIEKVTNSSAEIWPKLVDLGFSFFKERSVMVYSPDKGEQTLFTSLGWAGNLLSVEGDYLHVSDNNYGGLKSDMFMTESVSQKLEKQENGIWRKTVTLRYFNPQKYDNWLSGIYHDYVRLYVPQGSKLVSVSGAFSIWTSPNGGSKTVQNPLGWKEAGKTVFAAFITFKPQEAKTLTFIYDLPDGIIGEEWKIYVQRQSGTNIGLVSAQLGDKLETVDLSEDKWITLPVPK
ncbi:MAG: DUF4012 domain-containing protein [Patescibacteria group bacterium]